MERLTKTTLMLTCLLALILSGCMSEKSSTPTTDVESGAEEKKDLDKFVEAFGRVKAERVRNVNFDFRAEVEKLHIKKGQKVKKGDRLVTLDLGEFATKVNSKEYELLQSELEVKKLSSESYNQRSGIAKVRVKYRDNLNFELEELNKEKNRLNIVGNTIICDFEEGIISELGYAEGDVVTYEKGLLSIIDTSSIIVTADVPEEFIKDIAPGSRVAINPVADPKREYKGRVRRISSLATERNGETVVTVDIEIENKDEFLLPNYNVDVKIYAPKAEQSS